MTEATMEPSIAMDMIHSEDELRHALSHLLSDGLRGHETLMVYRNVRKKYSKDFKASGLKDGVRGVEPFRTVDDGVLASHRAGLCRRGIEREASAMYVTVNPRDVPEALKATHAHYYKWIEKKAGTSKEAVRKGDSEDFAATMDHVLSMNILKSKSRVRFNMIDADDCGPERKWLKKIREAIGEDAIEMIIETKNGYHVLYRNRDMDTSAHKQLDAVLRSDTGTGSDAKVTKTKGTMISCALPGGYQADHQTKIVFCSCQRKRSAETKEIR